MAAADMGGSSPNTCIVQGVRIPTYTVINEESFNMQYWPKLENAIQIILSKESGQPFNLSHEDLFSVAYKCASQQYSEKMFMKLTEMTSQHISSFFSQIEALSPREYLHSVDVFLAHFSQAVWGLASIFGYMDRCYVVAKFGKNITSFLNCQLAEKILSCSKLLDILKHVYGGEIDIEPQIIMTIIKSLYAIDPDFAKMNMALFSRFIPNLQPPYRIEDLPSTSEWHGDMQQEMSQNYDHERGISKRKVDEISDDVSGCRKRFANSR